MLILSGADDKLQLVTDAAADVEVSRSWAQNNGGAMSFDGAPLASIAAAATTDIVPAAGASQQRAVTHLNIRNAHASQAVNVTVRRVDATNTVDLAKVGLLAGEWLTMDEVGNWTHYDANGGPYPALGNIATQAELEAAASNTVVVTPGRMQYHPGVCKAWVVAGVTGNILASYNITSLTDTGTGVLTITIGTDFSSASYCVNVSVEATATTWAVANCRECHVRNATLAVGSVAVDCVDNTATTSLVKDPTTWHVAMYGDQ